MSKGTLRIVGRNLEAVRTIAGGNILEVGQSLEQLSEEVRTIINGDAEAGEPTIQWCRNGILASVHIRCSDNLALAERFKGWRAS